MDKIIFINNTAATSGGALTVLKQLLDEISRRIDDNTMYYVFTTVDLSSYNRENIKVISDIKGKTYKDRIIWDNFGVKKWAKDNNIVPNLIISMQNIAVRYKGIPQIIYLHQPLPYSKESKWNIFNKSERILWFYKNIYKLMIHNSLTQSCKIVVQTNWMKNALINNKVDDNNIIISKPSITDINIDSVKTIQKEIDKFYIFYPASDVKYKNHKIIIDALKIMKQNNTEIYNKIKVKFTLNAESEIGNMCKENNIDCVDFVGNIEFGKVMENYKVCDLVVFPSYIETFGLPLIEASKFNKRILVSDCDYAREVLENYNKVKYVKYNNANEWCEKLLESVNNTEIDNNDIILKSDSVNGWDSFFELKDEIIKM